MNIDDIKLKLFQEDIVIVQHFKYQYNTKEERTKFKYVYKIVNFAQDTETEKWYVVYQALYSPYKVWIREISDFFSEVDNTKYPNIKQRYKFEYYKGELQ